MTMLCNEKGDANTPENEGTETYDILYNKNETYKNENMQGLGEPEGPNLDATMMDSNLTDLHDYNTKATGSKRGISGKFRFMY
jgi:hypothetical protein